MLVERLSDTKFDEFFQLVESMVSESEFYDAVPNKQTIWNLHKNSNVVFFIAIKENKIVGFLGGIKGPYFFSTKMRVSDIGFYVIPECRGSRAAIKLLAQLEDWAKENNVVDIYLGQTSAIDMERTKKFYNRLGYATVGFNTIKHLEI